MGLLTRSKETAPCTVTISHRFEELSAHVKFNNGAVVNPGDTVQVQGPEIMAAYGELVEEERIATITRASSWNNSGPAPQVISNLWNSANSRFLKRCCHERSYPFRLCQYR